MTKENDIFWIAIVLKRTANGLHLTCKGAPEAPDSDVLVVESTGCSQEEFKKFPNTGPRCGWNQVLVTNPDGVERLGWVPWHGKEDDFWVIWNLATNTDPSTHD